jgi:MFS family permease
MIFYFTSFSIAGLTLFAISSTNHSFVLACIGRALYGIGAESQNIWLATVISIWFQHEDLHMATAILGIFGKFGSFASNQITPYTYEIWGKKIEGSFWIAMFINSISLVVAIFINLIEKDNDNRRKNIRVSRLEAKYMNKIKQKQPSQSKKKMKTSFEGNETKTKDLSKHIN